MKRSNLQNIGKLFFLFFCAFCLFSCQRTNGQNAAGSGTFTAYGSGTANVTTSGVDTVFLKATITGTGPVTIAVTANASTALDSVSGNMDLFVSLDGSYYFKPLYWSSPAAAGTTPGPRDSLSYIYHLQSTTPTPPSTLTFTAATTPQHLHIFHRTFYLPVNNYKFYMIRVVQTATNDAGSNVVAASTQTNYSPGGVPTKTWSASYWCRRVSGYQ